MSRTKGSPNKNEAYSDSHFKRINSKLGMIGERMCRECRNTLSVDAFRVIRRSNPVIYSMTCKACEGQAVHRQRRETIEQMYPGILDSQK